MSNLGFRARAAVALSLVISACGGTTPSSAPTGAASTPGAPGATVAATAAGRTIEDVCEAAAGTTVSYSTRSDVPDVVAQTAEFNKLWPDIGVTHVQEGVEDVTARLVTEAQAGRAPDLDVVSGNIAGALPLYENGLIIDVDHIALGYPESAVVEVQGIQVARQNRGFGGLFYNEETMNPADLPDTFEELLGATELRGKFMSDPRGTGFAALRLAWTQEEYEAYITAFVENIDPVLVRGTSAGIQKVLTGEFVTGDAGKNDEVDGQRADGAPIAIKFLDVVPAFDSYNHLIKGGPASDAGLCFAHWFGSPAGRDADFAITQKRNDDLPPAGLTPAGAVVASIETTEDVTLFAEAADFYAEALEGQLTVE